MNGAMDIIKITAWAPDDGMACIIPHHTVISMFGRLATIFLASGKFLLYTACISGVYETESAFVAMGTMIYACYSITSGYTDILYTVDR